MRANPFIFAAILAAMMPGVAWADDPNDPTMRNAAARARDREIIRQLNQAEGARVSERDARYAEERRASRVALNDYAGRSQDHQRAAEDYARRQAQYEREMAEWRHAVAVCRAGDYSACDN